MPGRNPVKPFPWKIFYRILLMQSVLVLVALGASGLISRYFFQAQFVSQVESRVKDALVILSHNLPEDLHEQWCANQAKDTALRLTVALSSGKLLCDSRTEPGESETFAKLEQGLGEGRFASTVRGDAIYGAYRVPGRGFVLRGVEPLTQISTSLILFDTSLGLFLLLAALTLGLFSIWSARRLVFPLGRLIVKTKNVLAHEPDVISKEELGSESFDEWLELESNIDDIRRDLAAKAQSLSMEQSELETIMGAISDAILAVDPEGNPLFFNSRFELLFGAEGLRKRNLKLWGIVRDPEIIAAFTEALKEGKTGGTKAIPLDQQGGLRRYFSLSVSPLRGKDGTVYGAVGIFHDVTELKSAEQMRIDFVANVSHELRTPLTVIKGYADTLIEDLKKDGGPMLEYLQTMARNSDRLMNLMNDLLDLSSIESADILQRDTLSTEEVTQRSLKQLEGAFAGKRQKVSARVQSSSVTADPNRVEQVVVNLLSNANKYAPPDSEIMVSWEPSEGDVLLKVTNAGPYIPLEHQSRLFERFYRIDKARSREQGGTGLGLAIVKHIMQRHGGNVWVESKPPSGATFVCRFPGNAGGTSQTT